MCLLFFAYEYHPNYHLILASNRDEFYNRPTEPARFWDSHPLVLAGQDLEKMGTWLGITKFGRFAALTNYRDPSLQIQNSESRGGLVRDFLISAEPPERYLREVVEKRERYNPFNLLLGNVGNLYYFNNITAEILRLEPGIYGLCNRFLDTPWPKVEKSKRALDDYLSHQVWVEPDPVFELLADPEPALDWELPDTGIGLEWERLLSAVFVEGTDYGTKSSAVLLIDRNNQVFFQEKTFIYGQKQAKETVERFDLVYS